MRERKISVASKCKGIGVVEPKAGQCIKHVFKLSRAEKSVTEVAPGSMHQPIPKIRSPLPQGTPCQPPKLKVHSTSTKSSF
jgi:hypothetical protein